MQLPMGLDADKITAGAKELMAPRKKDDTPVRHDLELCRERLGYAEQQISRMNDSIADWKREKKMVENALAELFKCRPELAEVPAGARNEISTVWHLRRKIDSLEESIVEMTKFRVRHQNIAEDNRAKIEMTVKHFGAQIKKEQALEKAMRNAAQAGPRSRPTVYRGSR